MWGGLLDGFYAANLRHVFFKVSFDSHLQGDVRGGAAHAGPVETNADDLLGGDAEELDIATIGLDSGADQVDDPRHAVEQGGVGVGGGGRRGRGLSGWRGHLWK